MENNKLKKTQSWNEKNLLENEDSKSPARRTQSWNEKYSDNKQEHSKLAGLRQRRKSVASDMTLPPIDEITNSKTVPRKSPSETSSGDSAFGRTSRRASVASTTSLLAYWSAASTDSNPDSIFKREPWTNKPGGANMKRRGSSTERRDSFIRRGSNSNLANRRTSFRTIGSRVTTLLKAKHAFARLKRKPAMKIVEDDKDMSFEIKELPKQPRFASTLSAEAQYAIMKGYEDVVHNYLCNTYPEYRNLLRRSRTPPNGVTVKPGENDENKKTDDKKDGEDTVDGNEEVSKDDIVTSTPLPGVSSPHEHHIRPFPTSPLPYCRTGSGLPRSLSRTTTGGSRFFAHYRSLPNIAPSKDRQLVMTYRYQCAMDILDNIRQQMGLQPLSPRVKTPKTTAVKEFNSWSYVWNKEFEVK